jgi:hypothetical protein
MAGRHTDPRRSEGLVALLAHIADSPEVGLDIVLAAGEGISEVARYNMWALERQQSTSMGDLLAMAWLEEQALEECRAAWAAYLSSSDRSSAHDYLISVLSDSAERLRSARAGDPILIPDEDFPETIL